MLTRIRKKYAKAFEHMRHLPKNNGKVMTKIITITSNNETIILRKRERERGEEASGEEVIKEEQSIHTISLTLT